MHDKSKINRRNKGAPDRRAFDGPPPPLRAVHARASKHHHSWLRRLAGWLGAILLSLLVTEGLLRWLNLAVDECQFVNVDFDAKTFVFDAQRLWRLDPTCEDYQVNEQGLRGWWPTAPKDLGELRIACVGDSCTFGTSVRSTETYGMQLASYLQRELPQATVNCALLALPGYSTYQDAVLLEQHAKTLQPDLVVLYCGTWNDYLPAWQRTDAQWAQHYEQSASGLRLTEVWRRLTSGGSATGTDTSPRELPHELMAAFWEGSAPPLRRVPLDAYEHNLRRMIATARAAGSKVVIVLPALPITTTTKYPIALAYRDVSRTVAAATGAVLFDANQAIRAFEEQLPPTFQERTAAGKLAFSDWAHPSAIGHGVIARALHAALIAGAVSPFPAATDSNANVAMAAPAIRFEIESMKAKVSWPAVDGARGYVLYYLQPAANDVAGFLDVVAATEVSLDLWPGAHFEVCVQAYGAGGTSAISPSLTVTPDGSK